MTSVSELKRKARHQLKGQYGFFVGAYLIAFMLEMLITSMPTSLFSIPNGIPLFLSQIAITYLLQTLSNMVLVGLNVIALKIIRHESATFADLFYTFNHQRDHFLALELIFTLIQTASYCPAYFALWQYNAYKINTVTYLMITVLCTIVSTVLTFLLTMTLSMAVFLMIDDGDLPAAVALRQSMRIMKGHTFRYFNLNFSFIGMYLLGILSLMIGFLWVVPYRTMTLALFYEDLRHRLQRDN